MTFCCEIELDGVKYKCEYAFWRRQFKFNPKPDDETKRRLIPRVFELMHEYFWAIEENCSRHDKPSEHECSWHVYGTIRPSGEVAASICSSSKRR